MAPRKLWESRGPARENHPGCLILKGGKRGQFPLAGTQYSSCREGRDKAEATGVLDQIMLTQGEHGNS